MSSLKIGFLFVLATLGVGIVAVRNNSSFDREVERAKERTECDKYTRVSIVIAPWVSTRRTVIFVATGGGADELRPEAQWGNGGIYSAELNKEHFLYLCPGDSK